MIQRWREILIFIYMGGKFQTQLLKQEIKELENKNLDDKLVHEREHLKTNFMKFVETLNSK